MPTPRFDFGKDIIVLDLETTGADFRLYSIAEIGVVRLDQFTLRELSSFQTLVRPYRMLFDPIAMEIHKISKKDLYSAPKLYDCLLELENWVLETTPRRLRAHKPLQSACLAAWGANFDFPFLREAYYYLLRDFPFDYQYIDIKSIARWEEGLQGYPFKFGVQDLSDRYEIKFEGDAHRALADARQISKIFRAMKERSLFEREAYFGY